MRLTNNVEQGARHTRVLWGCIYIMSVGSRQNHLWDRRQHGHPEGTQQALSDTGNVPLFDLDGSYRGLLTLASVFTYDFMGFSVYKLYFII